jgi:C-terminal processing protease CtpA/Prc
MSGMFVVAEGDDFHRLRVLSVVEGGPAAMAGIHKGDVIAQIDGQPAAKLSLEQLRESFRQAGAARELLIDRQNERLPIRLRLRRAV